MAARSPAVAHALARGVGATAAEPSAQRRRGTADEGQVPVAVAAGGQRDRPIAPAAGVAAPAEEAAPRRATALGPWAAACDATESGAEGGADADEPMRVAGNAAVGEVVAALVDAADDLTLGEMADIVARSPAVAHALAREARAAGAPAVTSGTAASDERMAAAVGEVVSAIVDAGEEVALGDLVEMAARSPAVAHALARGVDATAAVEAGRTKAAGEMGSNTAVGEVVAALVDAADDLTLGEMADIVARSPAVVHALECEARVAEAAAVAAARISARRGAVSATGDDVDGLCGARAIVRALGAGGQHSVRQMQELITGSAHPASWAAVHFVEVVRRLPVSMVVYRDGHAPRWFGVDSYPDRNKRRLYVRVTEDGGHVEAVTREPTARTPYVSVGERGEQWVEHLALLGGAHARSALVEAMRCRCCGRAASLTRSCIPASAWRPGVTGHRCLRAGGCIAEAVTHVTAQESGCAPPAHSIGHVECSARPSRPGVQCSPVFCAALASLGDHRARQQGWRTVGRRVSGAPAGYAQLRRRQPDLDLPDWASVLGPLDRTVPASARLLPARHYTDDQQEQWLGMDAGGDLPQCLAPLQRWAEHWAAAEAARQRRPTAVERGMQVGGGGRAGVVQAAPRTTPAAAEGGATGGHEPEPGRGSSAVQRTPGTRGSRGGGRRVNRRSVGPVRARSEQGEARSERGHQREDGQPPAPSLATVDRVPEGADEVHALLAASGRAVPHHVDGFMRQQGYHLHRILTVQPGDDPRLQTDSEYYRYTLAMQGPLAEYMLLDHWAKRDGIKWAQRLGDRLPAARALLPPVERVAFSMWDPAPLLQQLRDAEDSWRARVPRGVPPQDAGVCALAEKGRVAAARGKIRGEAVVTKPRADAALQAELQRKFPQPDEGALEESVFDEMAAEIELLRAAIPEEERISAVELLEAARRQSGPAAPGPDGWSGGFLRRLATLFPREVAEVMRRDYVALACGADPVRVAAVTEATVGGLAKPAGGSRPIVISRVTSRCILSYVTRRAQDALRKEMERSRQFGLTGVTQALLPPVVMAAKCAAAGVPFVITDDDFENAFNAVEQVAQARALHRVARSAPEFAACALRDQCITRGACDMVLRGLRNPGEVPLCVYKHARGCPQGSPASPPTFGGVMCAVEDEAEAAVRGLRSDASESEAEAYLWGAMRLAEPLLEEEPMEAWSDAVRRILRAPRPGPWGGVRGEASTAYLDDAHSGGWAIACIAKSLQRVAAARRSAGLRPNRAKCKVMTAERHRADVDAIIAPLRRGDSELWPVVTRMRVLGVEVVDPSDAELVREGVERGLRDRVVRPCRMLAEEILHQGARQSTAYWLLTRYIIPNATFYAQVWGLLSPAEAWMEADTALDEICAALAPADLRAQAGESAGDRLRTELSLPQRMGGLGIPRLSVASAHMAASQAPFEKHAHAREAGMLPCRDAIAYARDNSILGGGERVPVGLEKYCKDQLQAVAEAVPAGEQAAWRRRREQNTMRAGMWAFNSLPWERDRSLTHSEWDILWRLAFGGLSVETRAAIDKPLKGHTFRGLRVERAMIEAIEDVLPAGVVRVWHQPSPEHRPPDHAARCAAAQQTEEGWRRADIAAEFTNGHVITLDMRTVHLQRASALHSTVEAQVRQIENEKTSKYNAYYSHFRPYVVSLTGAVSNVAFGAVKEIAREASLATSPRLRWEKFRWAVDIVQRVAIATVKAAAWDATRQAPAEESGSLRLATVLRRACQSVAAA